MFKDQTPHQKYDYKSTMQEVMMKKMMKEMMDRYYEKEMMEKMQQKMYQQKDMYKQKDMYQQKDMMKDMFQDNYRNQDRYQQHNNMQYDQYNPKMMAGVEAAKYRRNKREDGDAKEAESDITTLPGVLDLGDRLVQKLKIAQQEAEQKIGNFTCVLKKMHVLNDEHKIDVEAMKADLEQYALPSEWFKSHIHKNYEHCYNMSQAVPQSVQDEYHYPNAPNLAQIKVFMTCCTHAKARTCLYNDLKAKLENNFGPLEKIKEQTQLSETQLFHLVFQLLHGDELDFFETQLFH